MSNEIDYDLVEMVAATHISKSGFLYQASSRLYELDGHNCWLPVSGNALDILELNLKPIPPRPEPKEPEYEYVKKEFSEPWEAAKASCEGVKLFVFDGDNNPCSLSQRNAFIDSDNNRQIYTRKEIKRDWRDDVVALPFNDGRFWCEDAVNQIGFECCMDKLELILFAKAALKAAGKEL